MDVKELKHVKDDSLTWEKLNDKLERKIMVYEDKMMMVKVRFQKGGIGDLHKHEHVQQSYVISGSFEVNIEGIKEILSAGDVFYIPSDTMHGVVCLEKGELLDVFTPYRKDFIS